MLTVSRGLVVVGAVYDSRAAKPGSPVAAMDRAALFGELSTTYRKSLAACRNRAKPLEPLAASRNTAIQEPE